MRPFKLAPLQAAIMFALGFYVGGGASGGALQSAQATPDPVITKSINESCASGDAVADFVCRNTWLANTRHSYR
jgi:hypothetical protein